MAAHLLLLGTLDSRSCSPLCCGFLVSCLLPQQHLSCRISCCGSCCSICSGLQRLLVHLLFFIFFFRLCLPIIATSDLKDARLHHSQIIWSGTKHSGVCVIDHSVQRSLAAGGLPQVPLQNPRQKRKDCAFMLCLENSPRVGCIGLLWGCSR